MISGKYKKYMNMFWDEVGRIVAKTGMTPNMVTVFALMLIFLNCLLYAIHKNTLVFGIILSILALFDLVDGAVARATGKVSKAGAYLDAVSDRYQEIAILLAIAYVRDFWFLSFFAITGSMLTSYNKARAGMEIKVSNIAWPDFFERLERLTFLCVGLIVDPLLKQDLLFGKSLLFYVILVLGVLTHFTAAQRFFRGKQLISMESASQ